MIRDNPPAFPREDYQADDAPGQRGMSLRDWFAGQALAGFLATAGDAQIVDASYRTVAKAMYRFADAMLAARKEGGEA